MNAMERSAAERNSTGVPFKKAGMGLVLILLRMPASSNRDKRKPSATPAA